jgi:hypothetical protein
MKYFQNNLHNYCLHSAESPLFKNKRLEISYVRHVDVKFTVISYLNICYVQILF